MQRDVMGADPRTKVLREEIPVARERQQPSPLLARESEKANLPDATASPKSFPIWLLHAAEPTAGSRAFLES